MAQTAGKKKQGSIVEILKEEILSGRIPCGREMTQNELAESLGVSRMPVREALILLEYQGLIQRLPNNHVKTADFSEDYFREIFSLCRELEEKALETGISMKETPKVSWFADPEPEELEIHRQISRNLSHAFLRKTLDTILEIYVDYAVRRSFYDKEAGAEKPDEKLFLLCAQKALASPCECVFVGDSLKNDIQGAERAGMHAVLYQRENKKNGSTVNCPVIRDFSDYFKAEQSVLERSV